VGRRARGAAHRLPGGAGEDRLEHIEWQEWFRKFEESDLAHLYQQRKADGSDSTFFKLIRRCARLRTLLRSAETAANPAAVVDLEG
jgi:hypothetical protein